jgi:hypothetical protein
MRDLYNNISDDYQGEKDKEDFEYTWDWFQGIKDFYLKVANSDKDVIFTADQ